MPTSPWPPGVPFWAADAVVCDLELHESVDIPDYDVGVRALRVLERVRQPLLDDAVRREVDAGREVRALALDVQGHGQARLLDLRDQPVEVLQPGLRARVPQAGLRPSA